MDSAADHDDGDDDEEEEEEGNNDAYCNRGRDESVFEGGSNSNRQCRVIYRGPSVEQSKEMKHRGWGGGCCHSERSVTQMSNLIRGCGLS